MWFSKKKKSFEWKILFKISVNICQHFDRKNSLRFFEIYLLYPYMTNVISVWFNVKLVFSINNRLWTDYTLEATRWLTLITNYFHWSKSFSPNFDVNHKTKEKCNRPSNTVFVYDTRRVSVTCVSYSVHISLFVWSNYGFISCNIQRNLLKKKLLFFV